MKKLSYACGTSSQPLLGQTIGDRFDEIVEKYPDHEALIDIPQQYRYTYTDLKKEADGFARALIRLGIKKGDRVGIWASNRVEWVLTQLGTSKVGAIQVNINPSYCRNELEYVLNQSGCQVLIMAAEFKTSNYIEMINDLAPELARHQPGKTELKAAKLPHLKTVVVLTRNPPPGTYNWHAFTHLGNYISQANLMEVQATLSADEPINIQYTSGTTGFPKGATLSHHNILNNGHLVCSMMKFTHADRLVIPVPLYHCFGMVMGNLGCFSHGATVIYACEVFEPEAVLKAVEQEKATALYGVPTMFIAELEHPNFNQYNLSSLRTGIMAGSSCPVEVMKQVNNKMHMQEVEIAYGMTETSPVSTQTRHNAPIEKRVSTVGQVMPHTEVKIIDPETGLTVPIGTPGELCTRGYCVMLGYWNDPERTQASIDAARWMHTGDLATMDEEGYINVVGRIKDMVIRGGENIYPREIEEFLYTHPQISDVQVIGVPDKKYGEEVMAWIITKEGEGLTAQQVKDYCEGQIAQYKVPRYIKFVTDFPMTVTGKIRKVEMRAISIKELGLEQAANIKTA